MILPMCPGYLPRYKTNFAIEIMNSYSLNLFTETYIYIYIFMRINVYICTNL